MWYVFGGEGCRDIRVFVSSLGLVIFCLSLEGRRMSLIQMNPNKPRGVPALVLSVLTLAFLPLSKPCRDLREGRRHLTIVYGATEAKDVQQNLLGTGPCLAEVQRNWQSPPNFHKCVGTVLGHMAKQNWSHRSMCTRA